MGYDRYRQVSLSIYTVYTAYVDIGDSCTWQSLSLTRRAMIDWLQLWSLATRLITSPSTSRAASFLLHFILSNRLVLWYDIAESVALVFTSSDLNGPATLDDAGLSLMAHLLRVRQLEVPSASLTSNQEITRWLVRRLETGKSLDSHIFDLANSRQ